MYTIATVYFRTIWKCGFKQIQDWTMFKERIIKTVVIIIIRSPILCLMQWNNYCKCNWITHLKTKLGLIFLFFSIPKFKNKSISVNLYLLIRFYIISTCTLKLLNIYFENHHPQTNNKFVNDYLLHLLASFS